MIENSFKDLVEQTFDFPQTEFDVNDDKLMFNNIELMDIVQQYGVPLKITYLPKIGEKIRFANDLFLGAMKSMNIMEIILIVIVQKVITSHLL